MNEWIRASGCLNGYYEFKYLARCAGNCCDAEKFGRDANASLTSVRVVSESIRDKRVNPWFRSSQHYATDQGRTSTTPTVSVSVASKTRSSYPRNFCHIDGRYVVAHKASSGYRFESRLMCPVGVVFEMAKVSRIQTALLARN